MFQHKHNGSQLVLYSSIPLFFSCYEILERLCTSAMLIVIVYLVPQCFFFFLFAL